LSALVSGQEKEKIAVYASETDILASTVEMAAAPIPPMYSGHFYHRRLRFFWNKGRYLRHGGHEAASDLSSLTKPLSHFARVSHRAGLFQGGPGPQHRISLK